MMRKIYRAACAMMAAGVLASCGDSTGPELAPDEGLVTFHNRGDAKGRFSARGGARPASPPMVEYAEARRQPGYLDVRAGNPLPNGRLDAVLLMARFDLAAGTFPVCSVTVPVAGPCIEVLIFINVDTVNTVSPGEYVFLPTSGSVRIEELSGGRVRGTFSTDMQAYPQSWETLEATSGRFDVPIRDL
jgi:hypothetical protein